jgi:hypothetical protein
MSTPPPCKKPCHEEDAWKALLEFFVKGEEVALDAIEDAVAKVGGVSAFVERCKEGFPLEDGRYTTVEMAVCNYRCLYGIGNTDFGAILLPSDLIETIRNDQETSPEMDKVFEALGDICTEGAPLVGPRLFGCDVNFDTLSDKCIKAATGKVDPLTRDEEVQDLWGTIADMLESPPARSCVLIWTTSRSRASRWG